MNNQLILRKIDITNKLIIEHCVNLINILADTNDLKIVPRSTSTAQYFDL